MASVTPATQGEVAYAGIPAKMEDALERFKRVLTKEEQEAEEKLILQQRLELYSTYAWFGKKPSIAARWKAVWLDRSAIEEQEEQLSMALDVFERASSLEHFTLFDLVAFSEVDRNVTSDFPYCVKLVNFVESAVLNEDKTLLDQRRAIAFVSFMRKVVELMANSLDPNGVGRTWVDDNGKVRNIPRCFQSKKESLRDFTMNTGIGYTTQYLPGNFLEECSREMLDPFENVATIPETERLIAHMSIVHWGLKGYAAVLRMCCTSDQVQWGMATSNEDGKQVEEFFAKNGIVLSGPPDYKVGTPIFSEGWDRGWLQVMTPGGDEFVLPCPRAIRQDHATFMENIELQKPAVRKFDMTIVDSFIADWKIYMAYVGQQMMRARHFALVGTSRKELVYIRRLKGFQDKTQQKAIALFITLGISVGQAVVEKLSRTYWS